MFDVGDLVKVRTNIAIGNYENGISFVGEMVLFRGFIYKVRDVDHETEYPIYRLEVVNGTGDINGIEFGENNDVGGWSWTDSMLEPINGNVNTKGVGKKKLGKKITYQF